MTNENEELLEVRCRACGVFLGYRKTAGRFINWCSEDCADTPMAKFDDAQAREEMIVELFLGGKKIMEISHLLDETGLSDEPWPYQYIQHTLDRRGLKEMRVAQHQRRTADGKVATVKEHRVLTRTSRAS
jgi:hypothetical protein